MTLNTPKKTMMSLFALLALFPLVARAAPVVKCELQHREVLIETSDNGELSPEDAKIKEHFENDWLCEDINDSSMVYRLFGKHRDTKLFNNPGLPRALQAGDVIQVAKARFFDPDEANKRHRMKIRGRTIISLVDDYGSRRLTNKSVLDPLSNLRNIVVVRVYDSTGAGTHKTALEYSNQFFGTCGDVNDPASVNSGQQGTVVDQFHSCSGGAFPVRKWEDQSAVDNDRDYMVEFNGVEDDGVIDFKLPFNWSHYDQMDCGDASDDFEEQLNVIGDASDINKAIGALQELLLL